MKYELTAEMATVLSYWLRQVFYGHEVPADVLLAMCHLRWNKEFYTKRYSNSADLCLLDDVFECETNESAEMMLARAYEKTGEIENISPAEVEELRGLDVHPRNRMGRHM